MNKEEKMVYPNLKLQNNHVLITSDRVGEKSKFDLSQSSLNDLLKVNQTVVGVGPNVPEDITKGCTVYLDMAKLMAKADSSKKQVFLRSIGYDKNTGEVLHDDNENNIKEDDIKHGVLITYNEILAIL